MVGPAWVGDMVMAQSLLIRLKQDHPGAIIDVLAPGWSRPLLARMPEVSEAIDMPLGHGELKLGVRRQLGRSLSFRRYDWAIVLPYTWKSALVPYWARIPRRTGYVGELRYGLLNDIRRLDKQRLTQMAQRYVALADAPGAPVPQVPEPRLHTTAESVDRALARAGVERPEGRLAVFCPGAEYGPAKRWPPDHFASVARDLIERGWQVWIMGSPKDAEFGQGICAQAGEGCTDLCGRTQLEEAIDLMSLSDVVVSNDSGLMHIAAALDRPLVALYGSSTPDYTPPLNARARILSIHMECSPCFDRECRFGHYRCLQELDPAQVERTIGELV